MLDISHENALLLFTALLFSLLKKNFLPLEQNQKKKFNIFITNDNKKFPEVKDDSICVCQCTKGKWSLMKKREITINY